MSKSLKKQRIVDCFLWLSRIVHYAFLSTGHTINKKYHFSVFRHLSEAISRKRPKMWWDNSWVLRHDNVIYSAIITREILSKHYTNTVPTISVFTYSPDMASCDYLFSTVIIDSCWSPFWVHNLIKKSLRTLKVFHKNVFKACFDVLTKWWRMLTKYCRSALQSREVTLVEMGYILINKLLHLTHVWQLRYEIL